MKKAYTVVMLIVFSLGARAQILRVPTAPGIIASQIPGYTEVNTINDKTISYTPSTPTSASTPVDGDSTTEEIKVYDYADVITANITNADGNITSTSVGKVWTLKVSIPNALNIRLLFNVFNLSSSAEMYIYDENKNVLDSAIKKSHFTSSSSVGISPINGSSVIVYIIEPNNFGTFQSTVSIQNVEAGYQNIADIGTSNDSTLSAKVLTLIPVSTNCDPLIQCEPSKLPYARAVARFFSNGIQGTGTLVNNEANNGRPLFLTAFHVIDRNKNEILDLSELIALQTATFQFQFWRESCNGSVNTVGNQFTGAILRAASLYTDMVLLELSNPPGIGDLVNYAGWNRQTSAPADYTGFIVHHPRSSDMRITSLKEVKSWLLNNNFWTAHYSSGTVDKGSSGSALMNGDGQIIGQLRSGWSSCNFTDFGDRFGKLYQYWPAVQTYLSPVQNAQSTNLLNLTDIPINGPSVISCTTPFAYSTLPGLLDVTYQWTVSAGLQIISGQGTAAVTISGLPGNQYGSGTLTLTLTSPTKGTTRVYAVSKNITINTGGSGSISGTYNSQTSSTQPLVSPIDRFDLTTYNNACLSLVTNMTNIPSGATVVWSGSTSSPDITWYQSGNDIVCFFTDLNQTADMRITVTTSCGETSARYRFKCVTYSSCGGPIQTLVTASPNPVSGTLRISLEESKGIQQEKSTKSIQEIRIIDKFGNIKRTLKYGKNQMKEVSIDLSDLSPNVYTALVYDGHSWIPIKIIKK
jgi:hypothetical protein